MSSKPRLRRADGGSISEEDYAAGRGGGSPIDRLKADLIARNNRKVPPEEIARNTEALKTEGLGMLPVVGNVMGIRDSGELLQDAVKDYREGRYLSAWGKKTASKAVGLASLLGLPTSRTAGQVAKTGKDTLRVFVPAVDDFETDLAREMRSAGADPHDIFKQTGRPLAAEGRFYEEIADRDLVINPNKIRPSARMRLGELVDHPQLFEMFPHLREHPVQFSSVNPETGLQARKSAQTLKDGTFLLPYEGLQQADIAKLLQYQIATENKMPLAVRHGVEDIRRELSNAADRAANVTRGDLTDLAAVTKYYDKINTAKQSLDNPNLHMADRAKNIGEMSSGNITSRRVQQRLRLTPEESSAIYPYGGRPQAPSTFQNLLPVLPPVSSDDAQKFLRDWYQFGSGKQQKFADGGRVKHAAAVARRRLAVGAVQGVTPGRADKLPVTLPEGAYVIPADIVSALGEGNTAAGFKKLDARFPTGKRRAAARANGGAVSGVDAIVSDGEFIISPDDVAAIGGGDIDRGHAALDIFVKGTRAAHIKRLQSIPDPAE